MLKPTFLLSASILCLCPLHAHAQKASAADDPEALIRKTVMMQATWKDVHTPHGATFEAILGKEEKAADGSMKQYYEFHVANLPVNETFTLEQWPLGTLSFYSIATNIRANEKGMLVCGGSKEPCGKETASLGTVGIWLQSAQGEPQRFLLSSDDDKVRITATVIPFPAKGEDQGCTIQLIRLFPKGEFFFTRGEGFQAVKDMFLTVESGGKKDKEHVKVTNDGLILNAETPNTSHGKDSGELRVTVNGGSSCHPTASITYGDKSDKKQ